MKHEDNYDVAVGGSRQRILNSHSYTPNEIFCFDRDQSIASYHPALLMRKNFPMKSRINQIIRDAFESGLFVKWNLDSQRKKERVISYEQPPQLSLEQCSFALVIVLCIGLILSIVAFFAELIVKWQVQKRPHFPWSYLEYIFCGHRHCFTNLPEKLQRNRRI